ncbi:MAG: NUDIX domain-containing protein [Bacteroidales bacterium]|nr:NUDIX domain-containing protein [Bacteroidales bacterium]
MKQTTLCYIDNGDSYLMLHRVKKENDASHGKWIGVGGKCEQDESPDECMLREVREETGLEITRWHYRGIVTFISDTWPNEYMHLFTATEWNGEPDMSIDDEGKLAWIKKSDLPVMPGVGDLALTLWEGDKIFLRLLLDERQPFFSLKLVYVQDEMTSATLDGRPLGTTADGTRTACPREDIENGRQQQPQAGSLRTNEHPQAGSQQYGTRTACPRKDMENGGQQQPQAGSLRTRENHCRKYLPHIEKRKLQFITYRLFDSLPKEVIDTCKLLTHNWEKNGYEDPRAKNMMSLIDRYEDASYGSCFLRNPRVASIVKENLLFHDGKLYNLHHWCIIPNHVHVLIEVLGDNSLSEILHSWRSYTAQRANELLGRSGQFWMHEYFDRYIRDQRHYETTVEYILNNPVKSGLAATPSDWPWLQ